MSRYGRKRISRRDVLKAAGALAASVAALGGAPQNIAAPFSAYAA